MLKAGHLLGRDLGPIARNGEAFATSEKTPASAVEKLDMANAGTWTRVARLIQDHPAVKQVRLDTDGHKVTVGFYEPPAPDTMQSIQTAVRRELSGEWDVSLVADGESPALHLQKLMDTRPKFIRRIRQMSRRLSGGGFRCRRIIMAGQIRSAFGLVFGPHP